VTLNTWASSNAKTVPFIEFPVYIFTASAPAVLTLCFNMTLNIDPAHKMSYDLKIDNNPVETLQLLPDFNSKKAKLPAEGWLKAVMDCVWKRDHILTHMEAGDHIIRVRLNHSNLLLEKMVLDLGGVKESYLGPPTSFLASS
jgi:hypothetical protein